MMIDVERLMNDYWCCLKSVAWWWLVTGWLMGTDDWLIAMTDACLMINDWWLMMVGWRFGWFMDDDWWLMNGDWFVLMTFGIDDRCLICYDGDWRWVFADWRASDDNGCLIGVDCWLMTDDGAAWRLIVGDWWWWWRRRLVYDGWMNVLGWLLMIDDGWLTDWRLTAVDSWWLTMMGDDWLVMIEPSWWLLMMTYERLAPTMSVDDDWRWWLMVLRLRKWWWLTMINMVVGADWRLAIHVGWRNLRFDEWWCLVGDWWLAIDEW